MALSAQDKQDMMEMIQAAVGLVAAPVVEEEAAKPAKAKPPTRASTDAKIRAGGLHRNMNHVDVSAGELVFRVVAQSRDGTPHSGGARVSAYDEKGHISRSLTRSMIDAMSEPSVVEQLRDAIETVDKRARLGAYKPTTEEREAAKAVAQS